MIDRQIFCLKRKCNSYKTIGLLNEFKTDIMFDSKNKSKTISLTSKQNILHTKVQNRKWNSEILLFRREIVIEQLLQTLIVYIEVSMKQLLEISNNRKSQSETNKQESSYMFCVIQCSSLNSNRKNNRNKWWNLWFMTQITIPSCIICFLYLLTMNRPKDFYTTTPTTTHTCISTLYSVSISMSIFLLYQTK